MLFGFGGFLIQIPLINHSGFDFNTYPCEPPGRGHLATSIISIPDLILVLLGRVREARAVGREITL